jgi:chromosome partitioning protein
VNLAAALALQGHRVLVIDMDSQGSASAALLDNLAADRPTTAHLLVGQAALADVIRPSTRPGVMVAPSSKDLTSAQLSIVSKAGRETILRRLLRQVSEFDLVLVDTAPEQQLATVNALVAASHVLMPFTPDPKALEGLQTTSEALSDLQGAELSAATVLGCVQIAYDRRIAATHQARAQVATAYDDRLLETTIRTNATFLVCPAWHRDIFELEKKEKPPRRGTEDFKALATEVAGRLSLRRSSKAAA